MSNIPTVKFLGETCTVKFKEYDNGRVAIQLLCEDGCPMATATVNFPSVKVGEGNVLIKTYSENEGMMNALIEAGIIGEPVYRHGMGFVEVPECPLLVKI